MAKVSVIIPVYNVEEYLAECLESVISQTYRDLEILCINDKSQDGSMEILTKYQKKDPRINILQNKENRGLAYTRNVGLERATGEYILFVDSDDRIAPDLIESCMKAGYGSDMVCFDYLQMTDKEVFNRQYTYKMRDGLYTGEAFFAESLFTDSVIFAAWSKLIRRKFLQENHISFCSGILYEDILFSFQCYTKAAQVYSIGRRLYEYRVRESSIMTSRISEKSIASYIICICELTRFYLQGEFGYETGRAIEAYIRKVCREYISTYRKWDERKEVLCFLENRPEYGKLYRTFSELLIRPEKPVKISLEQAEEIRSYPHVVLYGAGDIARGTIELMEQYDIPLCGIAVSSAAGNRKSLLGNPVRELQEYHEIRESCLVLIGTVPRYHEDIRRWLIENGFQHWMEMTEG